MPRGSCAQCHEQHPSHTPGGPPRSNALFAADDNELCFTCHTAPSGDGVFPGGAEWSRSTHATSPGVVPPSRSGALPEANRCTNCHEPHGNRDTIGVIPALLDQREPDLCLQCHDGSRAPDIRSELTKSFHHPMDTRGKHDPREGSDPGRFGGMNPGNRHADCADCHNVHVVGSDPAPPSAPLASNRLAGVSRVEVTNGGAGSLPTWRFVAAGDPGEVLEYQVCFKCHSSFTKQPAGQEDIARLLNPNNPSHHAVEAAGKNGSIDRGAFTDGWAAGSRLLCTSCHMTDDSRLRGPHGSSYAFILKKASPVTVDAQPPQPDQLCFDCHAFAVYAAPASPESILRASRFNGPASQGHAFHVAIERIPCYACHESHGSTRYASLIARRTITAFMPTPSGGTCTSTCHGMKSWTINYPR